MTLTLQLLCLIGFGYLVWWDRNRISEKGRGEITEVEKFGPQKLAKLPWFRVNISHYRNVGWRSRGGRAFRYVVFTLYEIKNSQNFSGSLCLFMKFEPFKNFRRSLADSPCPGSPHSARCRSTPSNMVTFSRFNNLKPRSLKMPVGILLLWSVLPVQSQVY